MEKMNNEMWHKKDPDLDDKDFERGRQSEKMVKFLSLAKNIPAFKGKSVEEVFSSEENKREFIKNLGETDFIDLIRGINALLREKDMDSPEMEWKNMQVEGGAFLFGMADESFSHRKDKADLYSLLHSAMQEMSQDERSMRDIALLCGASIAAIHGFGDGNGRTSRFIYSMLNNNLDNNLKNDLREILSTEGNDIIDINPVWIGNSIDELIQKEAGIVRKGKNKTTLFKIESHNPSILKEKTSEQDFKEFKNSLEKDQEYVLDAIFACFKNSKSLENYSDSEYKYILDADMFFNDLTEEEIEHLIEKYWELKKRKVEILIDCIAHPEKKEYQIKDGKKKISMKDHLAESIKNESEEKRERKEYWKKREIEENKKHEEDIAEAMAALERGGNNHIIHDPKTLNALRKIEKQVEELILVERQKNNSPSQESDEEKIEKLRYVLYTIARNSNKDADITQENVDAYLANRRQNILKNYSKYIIAEKIINLLEKAEIFNTKLSVTKISKDWRFNYYMSEEQLLERYSSMDPEELQSLLDEFYKNKEKMLADLLTQSVYYISPNNSSLRIKLYNINTDEEIVQPIMEQIFFYAHDRVEELGDGSIGFSDNVDLNKDIQDPIAYIGEIKVKTFEISSPEFDKEIKKQEDVKVALNSPIKTFKKEDRLYVKIPKGYMHHFGYYVDHFEKMN